MKIGMMSLLLTGVLSFAGCSDDSSDPKPAIENPKPDQQPSDLGLVETIVGDQRFTTLTALIGAAELETTLASGTFTIFAPTNDAFAQLPTEVLEALQADKAALAQVLTYHVANGNLDTNAVLAAESIDTVNGGLLKVSQSSEGAFINDSKLIETDLKTSNGVIHVLDKVLTLPTTIVDLAVNNSSFSTLVSLLTQANLVETLQSEGPFTVFAPSDEAFAKLSPEQLQAVTSDKELLTKILLYHVVPGKLLASNVLANTTLMSANNLDLMVSQNENGAFINESQIINTNLFAGNGVVHVIDTVLLPSTTETPAEPLPATVVDIAASSPDFTTLVQLVAEAGLMDTLKSAGPFTVFAPTNDAFAKLSPEQLEAVLADKELLTSILLYHVVPGKLEASNVLSTDMLSSANHLSLNVSLQENSAFVNSSKITATDLLAENGVVHVIDTVLLPPTVVDLAVENGNFNTLVDLLSKTNLDKVLSEPGQFTVFAPTDAAFAKIAPETLATLGKNPELLSKILLYHVVSGELLAKDVLEESSLTTVNDLKLLVTMKDGAAFINDAMISKTDIRGTNGVVHAIDSVLLP